MSSQGANASALSGYAFDTDSLRDASDWTRMKKEQLSYKRYNSTYAASNNVATEDPWLKYGNGFRLTYLFGKYKCGSCDGDAFGGSNAKVGGS